METITLRWKDSPQGKYHYKMMSESDEYRAKQNVKRMERYYRNAELEKAKQRERYARKKQSQPPAEIAENWIAPALEKSYLKFYCLLIIGNHEIQSHAQGIVRYDVAEKDYYGRCYNTDW